MPFRIIRNDITRVWADVIVNTANPKPAYGAGTDHAIYKAAGEEELLAERAKIGEIKVGEAAVTEAFALRAKFIIHTVGPIWQGGEHGEYEALASCYRKSLLLAKQLKCESIAFPLISSGTYGFPKDKALAIALQTISEFLDDTDMDVTLVVFNRGAFDLSASLVESVEQYIDEKYVEEKRYEEYFGHSSYSSAPRTPLEQASRPAIGEALREEERSGFLGRLRRKKKSESPQEKRPERPQLKPQEESGKKKQEAVSEKLSERADLYMSVRPEMSLDDALRSVGETFQERLLRLIDERDLTDAQVYKKANLDRKLFSKIRCNAEYTPKKKTALALSVALELNKDQTLDLLGRAGLTLSPSSKADLIVEYCIENHIYDIFKINALLFEYEQPMLGS